MYSPSTHQNPSALGNTRSLGQEGAKPHRPILLSPAGRPPAIAKLQKKYGDEGFHGFVTHFKAPGRTKVQEHETVKILIEKTEGVPDLTQALKRAKSVSQELGSTVRDLREESETLFKQLPELAQQIQEHAPSIATAELLGEKASTSITKMKQDYDAMVVRQDLLKLGLPGVEHRLQSAVADVAFLRAEIDTVTKLKRYSKALKAVLDFIKAHPERMSGPGPSLLPRDLYDAAISAAAQVGRKPQCENWLKDWVHTQLTNRQAA